MRKLVYFEVRVRSIGPGDDSGLGMGFVAMPYPTWRLPGWERASIGVHSDDGRKYVNDKWGGKDFTDAFVAGETYGIGLDFSISEVPPSYESQALSLKTEVFFTKNGKKIGGWNLNEELDAQQDLGIEGLEGQNDLFAAIGVFGAMEFDILFNRSDWMWTESD